MEKLLCDCWSRISNHLVSMYVFPTVKVLKQSLHVSSPRVRSVSPMHKIDLATCRSCFYTKLLTTLNRILLFHALECAQWI